MIYATLGIILVAAVVIGAVAWRGRQAGQSEQQEIRSAVVERGTMLVAVSASGSIEPQARAALSFESPGEVVEAPVAVGDRVAAGDVLARLDTAQLELQARQAEAALAMAEAQLAQLRDGAQPEEIASAEANVRAAEAQVSAAAASYNQVAAGAGDAQIGAVEVQVASAELQWKAAQIAYDMEMREEQNEAGKDQANYDLYAAEKALTAAQAQLDEVMAGADSDAVRAAQFNVAAVQAQRDAAQAQLDLLLAGAAMEQIADAEAQVEQARVALALAELAVERATLRAPFDGLVADVNVTVGEMASSALPAVTIIDVSHFRLTVSVDEIDVGRLSPGQPVEVTLDALPAANGLEQSAVAGSVERIAPAATILGGVVYYDVVIELSPTDAPIRADMTANATIVAEELAGVLMLPTWVVRVDSDTGQTYVNQRVGGEIVRTDVELGVRHAGTAQVLSGLAEGDQAIWVQETGPFGMRP